MKYYKLDFAGLGFLFIATALVGLSSLGLASDQRLSPADQALSQRNKPLSPGDYGTFTNFDLDHPEEHDFLSPKKTPEQISIVVESAHVESAANECKNPSGMPISNQSTTLRIDGLFYYDKKTQRKVDDISEEMPITIITTLLSCACSYFGLDMGGPISLLAVPVMFLLEREQMMGELEQAYMAIRQLMETQLAACRKQVRDFGGARKAKANARTRNVTELDFTGPVGLFRGAGYVNPLLSNNNEFNFYRKMCPNVTGINLRGTLNSGARWNKLKNSRNRSISNEFRRRPAKLRSLMSRLSEFRGLTKLNLGDNNLTEIRFSALPTTLQALVLNGADIRPGQLAELEYLTNLDQLELQNVRTLSDHQKEKETIVSLVGKLKYLRKIVFEDSPSGRFYRQALFEINPELEVVLVRRPIVF